MNMVVRLLAALTALPMLVIGLAWVGAPAKAAEFLQMPLLDGFARGSQIADGGALFLAMAGMIIGGLITNKRILFQIPAMIFMAIAFLRVLASMVHGAELNLQFVIIEVVSAAILLLAAKRLGAPV